jgi:hypothetical protein
VIENARVSASHRSRRIAATALVVVGTFFLLLGGALLYARQEIVDPHAFAVHASHALQDENVRAAIGDGVLNQVTTGGGAQLLSFRPALESVIDGVIASPQFRAVFRKAAVHAHDLLFKRDRESVVLDLADAGLAVSGAAKAVSPDLAKHIPKDIKPGLLSLTNRDWATDVLDAADKIRFLGIVLPILGLLCLGGAVAAATDRRLIFIRIGGAIAVAAVVLILVLFVGRELLLANFSDDSDTLRSSVGAVWDAFLGGLHTWALLVGAFGLVVAAAASSVLGTLDAASPAQRARRLIAQVPERPWLRALRAAGVFLVSLLVVLDPGAALEIAATVVGGYGIYYAVTEVLVLVERPAAAADEADRVRSHRRALVVAAATPIAIVVLAVIILTGGGGGTAKAAGDRNPKTCNGYAQLCDKPLNEVAFAATHNSMSAARRRGWFFANQDGGITEQLNYGFRGLLIDTHYGYSTAGGISKGIVRTAALAEGKDRQDLVNEIGQEAVTAAEHLGAHITGKPSGRRDLYLCHTLCELGDTPLVGGLKEITQFLTRHPDEVLIVFIQDAIFAKDTARAFQQAGLLKFVYTHKREDPWPTLRDLITSNKRLFVMYEKGPGDPSAPWYQNGFELTQETPYHFETERQLASPNSCRPNRGASSSPLFQVNNWIDEVPPPPGSGAKSNAYSPLLLRLERCERVRGLVPNIVGVDFYNQGNVLAAVNVINGLAPNAKPALPTH